MNSLKILDIFVGGKCNLSCYQCDTRSDVIRTDEYDQDIESILEGIKLAQQSFQIEMYSMLGGEPLLYLSKIKKIVTYIRTSDPTARIIIPTNGTLLHKHKTELADLLLNYNVSLFVCNHFAGFTDRRLSDKVLESALQFSKELNLVEYSAIEFNKKLSGTDISERAEHFLGKEQVFTNGIIDLWIRDQKEFHSHYYLNNGIPKPFASGNPEESYRQGCCSPMCSFLFGTKLFKCAALGTLERFLKHYNLLEDTDWQKYLAYKPLDLVTATSDEIADFSDTKFSAKPECDMCPSSNKHIFVKTEQKVINFYERDRI
jgi:organic radical activating enzyme